MHTGLQRHRSLEFGLFCDENLCFLSFKIKIKAERSWQLCPLRSQSDAFRSRTRPVSSPERYNFRSPGHYQWFRSSDLLAMTSFTSPETFGGERCQTRPGKVSLGTALRNPALIVQSSSCYAGTVPHTCPSITGALGPRLMAQPLSHYARTHPQCLLHCPWSQPKVAHCCIRDWPMFYSLLVPEHPKEAVRALTSLAQCNGRQTH